jgi:hypothetical protein
MLLLLHVSFVSGDEEKVGRLWRGGVRDDDDQASALKARRHSSAAAWAMVDIIVDIECLPCEHCQEVW